MSKNVTDLHIPKTGSKCLEMVQESIPSSSRPERFRALLNFLTVVCLLACIAFHFSVCLYNHHKFLAIEKRLDQVERIAEKIIADDLPKDAANQASFKQNEVFPVRERRSALKAVTNLQSLAKRVNVIESR